MKMKNRKAWLYLAVSAFLLSGNLSCGGDDDDTSALEEELKQKEEALKKLEESNKQLDETNKKLEKEKESLNEKNKQLDEANKKLDDLLNKISELEQNSQNAGDTATVVANPEGKKYDNPGWSSVAISGEYAYTMTVVFELPADLQSKATANDLMAAFVGDECRSVEKAINGVYLLTIIGTGEEEEDVTFRYWNAENHYMYESTIKVPFTSDLIFGVVDSPKKFDCRQM